MRLISNEMCVHYFWGVVYPFVSGADHLIVKEQDTHVEVYFRSSTTMNKTREYFPITTRQKLFRAWWTDELDSILRQVSCTWTYETLEA